MQKSFDLRGIPMSELNHAEALELAHLKKVDSNLARCYIDLATRPPAVDREPRPAAPVDVEKGTALASAALVEGVECRYHSFPGKQALCPIQRGPCLRKPCMITKGEG